MNKWILCIVMLLISIASLGIAYGAVTATVTTTAGTEFNDLTPDVAGKCVGNYTKWNMILYLNQTTIPTANTAVDSKNGQANNSAYTFTTNITLSGGYNYSYWVKCTNQSATGTSSLSKMVINYRPTVSASDDDSSQYKTLGKVVKVTGAVTDLDSNRLGNDTVRIYVCKTDAFSAGTCTGGNYCTNSTGTQTNSLSCGITIVSSMSAGTKTYYVYAYDDNNWASASSSSGTFKVAGRGNIGDGVFDQPPALDSTDKTNIFSVASGEQTQNELNFLNNQYWGIPLFVLILIGVGALILFKRKR